MEMKINFEQLFNVELELNTTQESPSIEFNTTQQIPSLNNSLEYRILLQNNFFDSDEEDAGSLDVFDTPERQSQSGKSKTNSVKRNAADCLSKGQKPGERLFYDSQKIEMRKMKEREQLQLEKEKELVKTSTFVPKINDRSRKMAEKIRQEGRQPARPQKPKPTLELLEEQTLKECTFQPKLIAKNNHEAKSKQELFYYLHNTSKIKEVKMAQMNQTSTLAQTKSKKDFSDFLKRNEEYASVVKKKQEILKDNAGKYDLKTGSKLFTPKITQSKAFNYSSSKQLSGKKLQQPSNLQRIDEMGKGKPRSGIFSKKNFFKEHFDQSIEQVKGQGDDEERIQQDEEQNSNAISPFQANEEIQKESNKDDLYFYNKK